MSRDVLNVAIIGLGHLHPRAYMPLFQACSNTNVVSVCDNNPGLLSRFCEDFELNGYKELDEMLTRESIDLAAIFLPHCDCAEAAIRCANKGVHLMVEKPIAETVEAVKKVAKAAKENNVKITTGYCWRYHPVIEAMKNNIEQGSIGKIVSVEARLAAGKVDRYIVGNSGWMLQKKNSGGGPVYNLGVHWIDILCYLLQDKIAEVCAINTQSSNKYDIEDNSIAMFKFASGTVGVLSTSYIVPDCFPNGRDLYIGIKGTKGVLSYSPGYEGEQGSSGSGQIDVLELYSDSEKLSGSSARRLSFQLDKVVGYSGYMGKTYVEDFVQAIIDNKEPSINVQEAIDVLNVVEAIYRSDIERKWVKVEK